MSKLHYEEWTKFLDSNSNKLNKQEQELLARLHSIYFKHSYYLPCTCSSKTLMILKCLIQKICGVLIELFGIVKK
jgi:hypothetical protein